MTRPEEIMHAVAVLVKMGKNIFTRKEVRDQIGISHHDWLYRYTAVFQGMRIDHPGGAPEVGKKFKGVFQRVERGKYILTAHGKQLLKEFDR